MSYHEKNESNESSDLSCSEWKQRIAMYIVPAVQGFFRSIALSEDNSLPRYFFAFLLFLAAMQIDDGDVDVVEQFGVELDRVARREKDHDLYNELKLTCIELASDVPDVRMVGYLE